MLWSLLKIKFITYLQNNQLISKKKNKKTENNKPNH